MAGHCEKLCKAVKIAFHASLQGAVSLFELLNYLSQKQKKSVSKFFFLFFFFFMDEGHEVCFYFFQSSFLHVFFIVFHINLAIALNNIKSYMKLGIMRNCARRLNLSSYYYQYFRFLSIINVLPPLLSLFFYLFEHLLRERFKQDWYTDINTSTIARVFLSCLIVAPRKFVRKTTEYLPSKLRFSGKNMLVLRTVFSRGNYQIHSSER